MFKEDIYALFIFILVIIPWIVKGKLHLNDDLPTYETVTYLYNLTSVMKESLDNPTTENGNSLLRSIYEYYNNLDDLYWMMKEEDSGVKNEAFKLVGIVLDGGLPIHLKNKINFDLIKVKFEWNDRSVQEVYDAIKESKALWENVEFMYNELNFDDLCFVTKSVKE